MNEKKFKYAEHLEKLPECPPRECHETRTLAYRFVHQEQEHPHNFLPIGVLQPQRKLKTDAGKCKAWGLSLFAEPGPAEEFYREQLKRFKQFDKMVGDHIATISIDFEDGVASPPEELNFGHFTFHEYLWCDFHQKTLAFSPIEK